MCGEQAAWLLVSATVLVDTGICAAGEDKRRLVLAGDAFGSREEGAFSAGLAAAGSVVGTDR
jgi:hypothetical protein